MITLQQIVVQLTRGLRLDGHLDEAAVWPSGSSRMRRRRDTALGGFGHSIDRAGTQWPRPPFNHSGVVGRGEA